MTPAVLVAGTASHVGKSTIAAGLCRYLANRGMSVAPYKAQNMSNNARVALTPGGDWGELGVSQYVQAQAAGVVPTTDMNPVLLKPSGDGQSQLVVQGESVGHFAADEYYESHWERARDAAERAYQRLADEHEIVVLEGAGSVAEINLHDRDLANVEAARISEAHILIAVDIERGGAFASLYGTLELMPPEIRTRVDGAVITKFRGDESLLDPGIEEIESRTDVPIIGVIPHDDPGLPEEDSISLPDADSRRVIGDSNEVPAPETVTIAVPRLPRISNFTDLEPIAREPGVRVAYVQPDSSLADADAVVLPGSKNTVGDLRALKDGGMDERLDEFDGPVVGLCGGYQMLGERITHAGIESSQTVGTVEGLGLLPVETEFRADKHVERVTKPLEGGDDGPLAGATGTATGYEIHMGRSDPTADVSRPVGPGSAARGRVLGTYLHGLFENDEPRMAFLASVARAAGVSLPTIAPDGQPRAAAESIDSTAESNPALKHATPYEQAADLVADHIDFSQTILGDY